ncbi:MAG: hypothetical protein JW986_01825 [Methanotrichaceae archaeon]|nr:hypothetical protein [Methanotrichaceae archaeon]
MSSTFNGIAFALVFTMMLETGGAIEVGFSLSNGDVGVGFGENMLVNQDTSVWESLSSDPVEIKIGDLREVSGSGNVLMTQHFQGHDGGEGHLVERTVLTEGATRLTDSSAASLWPGSADLSAQMAASAGSGYAYNDLSGSYSDLCSLSRVAEIKQGSMSVDQDINIEGGIESSQLATYRGSPLDAELTEIATWQNSIGDEGFYRVWTLGPGFDEHWTISIDSDCSVRPDEDHCIFWMIIRKDPG